MLDLLRMTAAFARRDFLEAISYRFAVALALVPPLFYLVLFFFVGKIFSGLGVPFLIRYGGEYFPFVVVGLAVQGIAATGLAGFSQAVGREQVTGTLEMVLVGGRAPVKVLVAAAATRYAAAVGRMAFFLTVAAVVFQAPFRWAGAPAFGAAVLLTAAAYFGLGMLAAAFVLAFKRGNPVTLFFGQLGALLAGVYFPVEVLPGWLKATAAFIPLTYGLAIARAALLGAGAVRLLEVAVLGLYAAVALALGYLALRAALARARRDGSLSHY